MMSINNFENENTNETLLKAIFKAIPSHVYYKDLDGKFRFASDICKEYVFKLTGKDLFGKTDADLYDDQELVQSLNEDDMKILETKKGIHFISQIIDDDGTIYCDVFKEPLLDEQGNVLGIMGLVHDITEQKSLEIVQRNLSRIDILTGLNNRLSYEERLKNILNENSLPLAVVVGDTNQLKFINDNYGHMTGDSLLKITADILKKSASASDEVFRIGGDEFVILCPQTDEHKCLGMIEKIKNLESACDEFQFHINTSLGYAVVESAGDDLIEKIKLAEKNMYEEKRKFYDRRRPI